MTVVLAVCAVLTAALTAYSLGHYLCAVVFLFGRRPPRAFPSSTASVAVLVPARNEGDRALRVVTSLLQQDHGGPLEVYLLLNDTSDTSVARLAKAYPEADFDVAAGAEVEVVRSENRRVVVAFTGSDPKSEKINAVAGRLTTEYVAILDCDHQAYPDFVTSSLALLRDKGAKMVQARRDPLSARGFFKLWDSLHQHIGCELFNTAFTRLGMTVFFTGTTAVLETALLKKYPFGASITEDIDFSYRLLSDGVVIIDNPYSGSCEETSPDLYSFLARRRRWANGHTSTFFRHLRAPRRARLSLRQRIQFLYHGTHYLVSVGVFALHLLIGIVFIRTFSTTSQFAAVLSSVILAFMIGKTQRSIGFGVRLAETVVVFVWLFPAVVIAMNIVQAILLDDFSRAALPISRTVQALGLVGLLAPLVVLLVGLAGFRQLRPGTFFAVVLSYPVAFYVDLCGVLLGMTDWVLGAARWRAVSRTDVPAQASAAEPSALLPALGIKDSWRLGSVLAGAPSWAARQLAKWAKPANWIPGSIMSLLFCAGAMFTPSTLVEVVKRPCEVLEQDGEPWIVPAERMKGYCSKDDGQTGEVGKRTGTFHSIQVADVGAVEQPFWDRLDKTFFCNLSKFDPDNVVPAGDGGFRLALDKRPSDERDYASGGVVTKDKTDTKFTYGRFETVMKPARVSGVITAFFLYRFDPWQEIDAEFLGRDTTKLLINVYYNPGQEGDLYNYGHFGTPVLVDLGFDAADDFHKYAIEWEAEEIRWLVDDKLVHVRKTNYPTPIPHLPMRFYVNMWPCCSEKLAGPFSPGDGEITSEVKSIAIARWYPAPFAKFISRFDNILSREDQEDWRKNAKWIR